MGMGQDSGKERGAEAGRGMEVDRHLVHSQLALEDTYRLLGRHKMVIRRHKVVIHINAAG